MLSKNKIKQIRALESKKGRKESDCFLAEGNKLVGDSLTAFDCQLLVATEAWFEAHPTAKADECLVATPDELRQASLLKNPQEVLAVCRKPHYTLDSLALKQKLTLVLDGVQDPGNVGTIVRLADWFGIENVICSPTSADIYNPKTVQATMGAIARIKVHYTELPPLLEQCRELPIYGTFLDGNNMYGESLAPCGMIVMGNEGQGISSTVAPFVTQRLYIPSYPADRETSESLNVAVATAIICAEFCRPK